MFKLMHYVMFTLLLIGATAHATGKVSVQGAYYPNSDKFAPMFGLAIYEKMTGPVAYNGWTGMGEQPFELSPDVKWFSSRHDLDICLAKNLITSAGIRLSYVHPFSTWMHDLHVKVSYQLW